MLRRGTRAGVPVLKRRSGRPKAQMCIRDSSVGFREVPEFLQEQKQLTPDDLETGETVKTPRGTFHVTAMSREIRTGLRNQGIGSCFCQLFYNTALSEQVTKHEHTNQRSCCSTG